ncbi:hypothetical protein GN244_ATG09455 [Phytophthora infestans]|uniref:Uncharacterized protein n=1 Tax=Phytophthora infestans TaxID=4787 RepID=A0A833SU36_PHYIN|nr:hypothetical protein GN244_ATG09455 [Phytophthora infestans]
MKLTQRFPFASFLTTKHFASAQQPVLLLHLLLFLQPQQYECLGVELNRLARLPSTRRLSARHDLSEIVFLLCLDETPGPSGIHSNEPDAQIPPDSLALGLATCHHTRPQRMVELQGKYPPLALLQKRRYLPQEHNQRQNPQQQYPPRFLHLLA